ncbi:MAG: DUF3291 domain-containing protein [Pseudomonadota bacterium]
MTQDSTASAWHLAQINVGRIRYPTDDPRMHGFMSRLDEINALAEASPGFCWRLQGDSGNATDIIATEDERLLVNLSLWESAQALFDYVYRSDHRTVMRDRRRWFEKPEGPFQALWWVPAGHEPGAAEGLARLAHLREHGPTPAAFHFKARYPEPGRSEGPEDMQPEPYCSGWR